MKKAIINKIKANTKSKNARIPIVKMQRELTKIKHLKVWRFVIVLLFNLLYFD
jgi:hypothetical protein